jgi:hypothetical protein
VKPDGENPVPQTVHAVFRDQQATVVAQYTASFIQQGLVVNRVMKHIQQQDDIITSGAHRQRSSIENLEWNIGLIDVDDIQAQHLTALSVAQHRAQVTAPGAYIQ